MNGKFCPSCGQHQIAEWVNICDSCSKRKKSMVRWIGQFACLGMIAFSIYWYINQYIIVINPKNINIINIFSAIGYHVQHLNLSSAYTYILPALFIASAMIGGLINILMYKIIGAK